MCSSYAVQYGRTVEARTRTALRIRLSFAIYSGAFAAGISTPCCNLARKTKVRLAKSIFVSVILALSPLRPFFVVDLLSRSEADRTERASRPARRAVRGARPLFTVVCMPHIDIHIFTLWGDSTGVGLSDSVPGLLGAVPSVTLDPRWRPPHFPP